MPNYEFDAPRVFVDDELTPGVSLALDRGRANYLINVMRLGTGARVLVFNGRDGEFAARLGGDRKRPTLSLETRVREQTPPSTLRFLFAPIKHARLDYLVEKAVELGAGTIEPVITRRTQVARVNTERMQANIIEAAEQCGIISLPKLVAPEPLAARLAGLAPHETLIFCDENAPVADPIAALRGIGSNGVALIIGPEGGFDPAERQMLTALPACRRIALGPRILRADTAAVAALTLVQAVIGDWSAKECGSH